MKILNLCSGLGGNRRLWGDNHEITAVELDPKIAKAYQDNFPNDKVITGNAEAYLLQHYKEFDFIWISRPCQSHTRMIRCGKNRKPILPDMSLYGDIIFLQHNFKGKWVVENVKPYYIPLIKPTKEIGRHLIWANFDIEDFEQKTIPNFIMKCNTAGAEELKKEYGLNYKGNIYYKNNHDPAQVLRNCVNPNIALHILTYAIKAIFMEGRK
jgi:DNA (cytosine-5)-methyltransferase 1